MQSQLERNAGRTGKPRPVGAVAALLLVLLRPGAASADAITTLADQVSLSQYTQYQFDLQQMGLGLYGGAAYNQGYRNRYNSGGPTTESEGFKEANLYLLDVFTGMKAWAPSLTISQQSAYKNVIAELPGADPDPMIARRILVVGAHYDHPQSNGEAPGGDDNASGTAAVLEAARILSRHQYRSTIRFIAWGAEEGWMLGSWDYVRNVVGQNVGAGADPQHENVVGVLNLDMILRPYNNTRPTDPIDLDIGTRVAYPQCVAWAEAFRAAAAVYVPSLPIDPLTHGADYYEWYASDQGSFMRAEDGFLYPALILAENTCHEIWGGSHPWYHTANDASDRLAGQTYDYQFATDVVRATVALLAQQAELQDPPVYSLGNRVFADTGAGGGIANNGLQDGAEPGIASVSLSLFADTDGDGQPDAPGSPLATVTTDSSGYYRFDGVPTGKYLVRVNPSSFGAGQPLAGLSSSAGAVPSGSNGTDQSDNGVDHPDPGLNGILSGTLDLDAKTIPTTETDNQTPGTYGPGSTTGTEAPNAFTDLTVDFGLRQSPPTAARLDSFTAIAIAAGPVQLRWGTLVEFHILGFRVERSTGDGGWQRIAPQLIPATGVNGRPQTYEWTDDIPRVTTDLAYRLIEVNLNGEEHALAVTSVSVGVIASIALTANGLSLNLRGTPHASVTVETATAVEGPWIRMQTIPLDGAGTATVSLNQERQEPARFYRVLSQ